VVKVVMCYLHEPGDICTKHILSTRKMDFKKSGVYNNFVINLSEGKTEYWILF